MISCLMRKAQNSPMVLLKINIIQLFLRALHFSWHKTQKNHDEIIFMHKQKHRNPVKGNFPKAKLRSLCVEDLLGKTVHPHGKACLNLSLNKSHFFFPGGSVTTPRLISFHLPPRALQACVSVLT